MAMTITYPVGDGLYLNLTNRCNCACTFCLRHNGTSGSIYADDLWLDREPTRDEVYADLLARPLSRYSELVFCGFGEPMCRADDMFWIIDRLREAVPQLPPVRVNTNGHGSLICGRDITSALRGRFDTVSISLNAPDEAAYLAVTRPKQGSVAFAAMLDFTRGAARVVPNVVMTVVDSALTPAEIEASRALAHELGATLRVRTHITG